MCHLPLGFGVCAFEIGCFCTRFFQEWFLRSNMYTYKESTKNLRISRSLAILCVLSTSKLDSCHASSFTWSIQREKLLAWVIVVTFLCTWLINVLRRSSLLYALATIKLLTFSGPEKCKKQVWLVNQNFVWCLVIKQNWCEPGECKNGPNQRRMLRKLNLFLLRPQSENHFPMHVQEQ